MAVHFVQSYCSCITLPAQHMEAVDFILLGCKIKQRERERETERETERQRERERERGRDEIKPKPLNLPAPKIDTRSRQDR